MKLIYIHGANATGESFNYIREHLNHNDDLVVEYSTADGFNHNLFQMKRLIKDCDNIFFVAHSMGGIYALHLADLFPDQVLGAVTISTPYGGSRAADYVKYFLPFSKLLRDIGPNSHPMRLTDQIQIQHLWTNIVTTRGTSLWMTEPNDGVVTIESQKHRKDMKFVELPLNHYEVVMSPKVVKTIQQQIKKVL
jgi:pimeloyl-ACP methyl ester carboxylesterase